jgi:hypothetical protein
MAFVLVGTAAAAFAAYRYNAPPVAPDFTIGSTTVPLSGRCAPDRVARHLISRLDAFDSGRARAFSRGFPARTTPARLIFNPTPPRRCPATAPPYPDDPESSGSRALSIDAATVGLRPGSSRQPGAQAVERSLASRFG